MMCPVCIATAVWITAGVTSTGGISAVVVSCLRGKTNAPTTNNENQQKGESHG
jgi:hypothetical protein